MNVKACHFKRLTDGLIDELKRVYTEDHEAKRCHEDQHVDEPVRVGPHSSYS